MGLNVTVASAPWAERGEEFHQRATKSVGLSDFGSGDYREGLGVLLAALDDHPPAGTIGAAAERLIVSVLSSRLHTEAQWQANPGYRSRKIVAPLIVIGVPRTGTTALHNLLSLDTQFQGIEKWLTAAPIPRPPRPEWDEHPRYQACLDESRQMAAIAPEVTAAHGIQPHDVDECLVPMAQSFCNNFIPSQIEVPLYDRWFIAADEEVSYRRYMDVLRLVGLDDDRRWLLKNPSHVFGIDALLKVFPDACIVQTHRHPAASLASLVDLLSNIMRAYTGQDIDRPRRLARETAYWAEAVRRSMAAQDRQPERFVNIRQREIRRDPLGVVRTIYARFGLTLSPRTESAMQAWAVANSNHRDSARSYADVTDQASILDAFGTYIERYGL